MLQLAKWEDIINYTTSIDNEVIFKFDKEGRMSLLNVTELADGRELDGISIMLIVDRNSIYKVIINQNIKEIENKIDDFINILQKFGEIPKVCVNLFVNSSELKYDCIVEKIHKYCY